MILSGQNFSMSSLDHWPCDLNVIEVIYFLWYQCIKFHASSEEFSRYLVYGAVQTLLGKGRKSILFYALISLQKDTIINVYRSMMKTHGVCPLSCVVCTSYLFFSRSRSCKCFQSVFYARTIMTSVLKEFCRKWNSFLTFCIKSLEI